jgi:hypothetical protein
MIVSNCTNKREYWKAWASRKRIERKEAGLCKCGRKPEKGYRLCLKCLEFQKKYRTTKIQKADELGLCTACNKNPRRTNSRRCEECSAKTKEHNLAQRYKTKKSVFDHYGNKCQCCGEENGYFLDLDHINNDGHKHRKAIGLSGGSEFYRWVIKNNFPDYLQLLCANCNQGKRRNGGVCPHQQRIGKDAEDAS